MKSRRLTVLLVIFCFVVLVVILSSTIFTLQSVSLTWLTTRSVLSTTSEENIISSVEMPMGESVFLLKKSEIKDKLEKANPYLEVVSIETVFPNQAVVYVAERIQLYAIAASSDSYVILDKNLKILSIINSDELFSISKGNRPVIVNIERDNLALAIVDGSSLKIEISNGGIITEEKSLGVGEILDVLSADELLLNLTNSLLEANYKEQSIRGFIENIIIDLNSEGEVEIQTISGIKIVLRNSLEDNLTKKLVCGISAYEKLRETYNTTCGTIEVFKSGVDNKIYAVHSSD